LEEDVSLYDEIRLMRGQLHEQIADAIQALVADQKLQPGEKLPPERDLAETLNVSRPTIREALRLLQSRGLVIRKAGSGTYVTEMGSTPLIQTMERFFFISDCSFEDLMETRVVLEPATSALAAANATGEQIQQLEERLAAIERAFKTGDPAKLAVADSQFHVAIAQMSGNQLLSGIAASIDHLVRKWNEMTSAEVFDERIMKSHWDIVHAIRDRDPEKAHQAMLSHIRMSRSIFPSSLAQVVEAQNNHPNGVEET
jgi:GntR family transcriptional repressor for pyruvate dehydrogenase complex